MNLACTSRMAALLEEPLESPPEKLINNLLSWHVTLRELHNRTHLFFTNDLSLYSFYLLDIEPLHLENLKILFITALRENLLHEQMPVMFLKEFSGDISRIRLIPSNSRRVQGSMGELVKRSESRLAGEAFRGTLNPVELNSALNRFTMASYLEGRAPIEVMRQILSV